MPTFFENISKGKKSVPLTGIERMREIMERPSRDPYLATLQGLSSLSNGLENKEKLSEVINNIAEDGHPRFSLASIYNKLIPSNEMIVIYQKIQKIEMDDFLQPPSKIVTTPSGATKENCDE